MSKTPIVLQVLPSLNQGGVERATVDMARALVKDSSKTPTYVASAGGAYVEDLPKKAVHLTVPLKTKNPLKMILNAFRLAVLIKKHHIQLVHARSRAPAWSAWLACKITGTPFITTYHAAYRRGARFKHLYNSIMARGSLVIIISQFMEEHVKRHYPFAKTRLIYEGIDETFFMPQEGEEEPKTVLLPSRLSPTKGIFTALEALKILIQKDPAIKLLLIRAGKDSHLREIEAYIKKNHLQWCVEFLVSTADLRPYYGRAGVVIAPSLVPEAFGRVAVEAMMMGKIVVASNLGALRENIVEGETGFLFSPGNPRALAEKILHVLALKKTEKKRIQEAARTDAVERFSLKTMTDQTIKLYRELV